MSTNGIQRSVDRFQTKQNTTSATSDDQFYNAHIIPLGAAEKHLHRPLPLKWLFTSKFELTTLSTTRLSMIFFYLIIEAHMRGCLQVVLNQLSTFDLG